MLGRQVLSWRLDVADTVDITYNEETETTDVSRSRAGRARAEL